MHCHLMNFDDANAAAFAARHVSSYAALPVQFATNIAGVATDTAKAETRELRKLVEEAKSNNISDAEAAFRLCEKATSRQKGFGLSDNYLPTAIDRGATIPLDIGDGRKFGFTSNRLRNASLMMMMWPEIDFFMPSMVDFYEGIRKGTSEVFHGEHPKDQAEFYTQLHLASRGRFLPLVSFNPERKYFEAVSYTHLTLPTKRIV